MKRWLVLLAACGTNQTPQPMPASPVPSCVPNRDGTIVAAELPVLVGATAAYYTGTNRTVALSGEVIDLSEERADDQVVAYGPIALQAQWYAPSFPAGQFVLEAGSGLDGIYHQDDRALWLDGVASHAETPKTLVVYPMPVSLLRFPARGGDAYSQTVQLPTATINGLPFVGSDQFEVDIVAHTRLDLPYLEFSPVLELRTHVVRKPTSGGASVGRRTTSFLFECFGEVARAESKQDEPAASFTSAAFLRRFALGETP